MKTVRWVIDFAADNAAFGEHENIEHVDYDEAFEVYRALSRVADKIKEGELFRDADGNLRRHVYDVNGNRIGGVVRTVVEVET